MDPQSPAKDAQGGHSGHDMSDRFEMQPTGTALPAGSAPAPRPPMDHFADRQFPPEVMERARHQTMFEQGGQPFYQIMFTIAEVQRSVERRVGKEGVHKWSYWGFADR